MSWSAWPDRDESFVDESQYSARDELGLELMTPLYKFSRVSEKGKQPFCQNVVHNSTHFQRERARILQFCIHFPFQVSCTFLTPG